MRSAHAGDVRPSGIELRRAAALARVQLGPEACRLGAPGATGCPTARCAAASSVAAVHAPAGPSRLCTASLHRQPHKLRTAATPRHGCVWASLLPPSAQHPTRLCRCYYCCEQANRQAEGFGYPALSVPRQPAVVATAGGLGTCAAAHVVAGAAQRAFIQHSGSGLSRCRKALLHHAVALTHRCCCPRLPQRRCPLERMHTGVPRHPQAGLRAAPHDPHCRQPLRPAQH